MLAQPNANVRVEFIGMPVRGVLELTLYWNAPCRELQL